MCGRATDDLVDFFVRFLGVQIPTQTILKGCGPKFSKSEENAQQSSNLNNVILYFRYLANEQIFTVINTHKGPQYTVHKVLTCVLSAGVHCEVKAIVVTLFFVNIFSHNR